MTFLRGSGGRAGEQKIGRRRGCIQQDCFLAVGLLVASVPVVRVVRVFAMGHEEMKVASGETYRAECHDADTDYCASFACEKALPRDRSLVLNGYGTVRAPLDGVDEFRT